MTRPAVGWLAFALLALARPAEPHARRAEPHARHAKPATAPRPASCVTLDPLLVRYRFHTGAPPTGAPVIGADGTAYLGTTEGYAHALRPDGSYRWSYTTSGAIIGRLALLGSLVLVPTARKVYALDPTGRLVWLFRSPVPLDGGLVSDGRGHVLFASATGNVFALSSRGGVSAHVASRGRVSAAPLALADGSVVVGRADGTVLVSLGLRRERQTLEGPVEQLFGCPGARFCAVAGGELVALDAQGTRRRGSAAYAAANEQWMVAASADGRVTLWDAVARQRYEVALAGAPSAAPLLDRGGRAYVPLRSGELMAIGPDGRAEACAEVADSPLGAPVLLEKEGLLLVTASEGWLAAIAL